MNTKDEHYQQTIRNHEIRAEMLDELQSYAIEMSDTGKLLRDDRLLPTVLDLCYLYRSTRIEVRISISWLPLHRRFEVAFIAPDQFADVMVEGPEYIDDACETLLSVSDRMADQATKPIVIY